ncbi:MAG: lipid II flippase MurJ, partial [Acetomicrobium sp.]
MFRAFLVLSSGSVIGKFIGFLREILMAALFGTGTYVAAYRVAQTAMLMPIEYFLTNSLEAGFVPLYVRYAKEDPKKARAFLTVTVMLFLLLAGIIFLFLYLGSSWWVKILAPGMDDTSKALTASMLHVMALAVPLYILGMLMAYLEMAHDRYLTASLRSTIQSVGL